MNVVLPKLFWRLMMVTEKLFMAITVSAQHPSTMRAHLKYFAVDLVVMTLEPIAWGGLQRILIYTARDWVASFFWPLDGAVSG